MRIYTKSGDLAFRVFDFPDSCPHLKLETYEREFSSITVEMAIANPRDLFLVVVVADVLRRHGYATINLDIRYLMGARMDRAIDWAQPFTLDLVARIINSCGFSEVGILDVHSDRATKLIRNSKNILPHKVVQQVLTTLGPVDVCSPDKGARNRVIELTRGHYPIIEGSKHRDMATGALTGFSIDRKRVGGVLIIDDICDGGGTFTGLAKVLREAGAPKVYLYVTHGIFSKGWPLEGIDKIYTTDSIFPNANIEGSCLTVIPITMKEIQ